MRDYIKTCCLAALLPALVGGGCSIDNQPRRRIGSYATPTPGTNFIDIPMLGNHSYELDLFETNGILYTCQGGHIDITHLRLAADYVRYLYATTVKYLMRGKPEMRFKFNVDRSLFYASFSYPSGWKTLDAEQKKPIAREVALELAQYFAFTAVSWHEVLTFYGFKTAGVVPEFPSAFSWEDTYSNAIGVYLGAKAVLIEDMTYNEAMTMLMVEELESLGAQPADVARAAAEQMRGQWFDGMIFVTMHVRNTDIGLDDGRVWPMLVPNICEGALRRPYPAPQPDALNRYGFGLSLEVEPREFEKGRILRIIYPQGDRKRLDIDKHLPVVMAAIEQQTIESGGIVFRDGRCFPADDTVEVLEAMEDTSQKWIRPQRSSKVTR